MSNTPAALAGTPWQEGRAPVDYTRLFSACGGRTRAVLRGYRRWRGLPQADIATRIAAGGPAWLWLRPRDVGAYTRISWWVNIRNVLISLPSRETPPVLRWHLYEGFLGLNLQQALLPILQEPSPSSRDLTTLQTHQQCQAIRDTT